MTICNKIQTLGETMETNLNARGVSCTFGIDTGESTVLEMVEMVNSTNLKGSSDVNLKIGANRPYLLTGETTDVIIKLENGLCEPLKNKNVIVGQSVFRDDGTTGNKNTNYTTGSALTISTTTDGTSVSSTSSNSTTGRYKGNTAITGDFELIADVKGNQAYSSTVGLFFGVYSNDYTIFRIKSTDWVKVKITRENSVFSVQTSTDNGTTWTDATFEQNNSTSNSVYPVLYVYHNSGSSKGLSYKNLVINNTLTGVTDEKGEFALYNVSVTDDTTFTATYGTETASCLVEYCDFVDYAVTNNKNNTWFNNTGGIITVDDSGTTFTSVPHGNGTHWTCGYCPSSTTSRNPFSYPIIVEFDILHWTDNGSIWIKSDLGNRTSFNRELNHIGSRARIEIGTTSTKIYIDGTLVSTKTYTQPSTYGIEIGYYTNKSNFPTAPSLKFANLSIRPL